MKRFDIIATNLAPEQEFTVRQKGVEFLARGLLKQAPSYVTLEHMINFLNEEIEQENGEYNIENN